MYVPDEFGIEDSDSAYQLIDAYNFGLLVSCEADQPVATHLPFLVDRNRGAKGVLVAHMARANAHWEELDGRQAMAIFQGPHGYVSPSWYAEGPAVPTWNYAAVHVYGQIELVTAPDRLREIVFALAHKHESDDGGWRPETLPDRYVEGMLSGIVGLDLTIERLEAKHKLSQNRPAVDQSRVIDALWASANYGDRDLAGYMAKYTNPGSNPVEEEVS